MATLTDFPPAYDALSIHQAASYDANQPSSPSAIPGPVAGPSRVMSYPYFASLEASLLNEDRSLPRATSSLDITPSSPINAEPAPPSQRPPPRKNSSWFSLLPFASTFSAKKARQSVLSIVSDLAFTPSGVDTRERENVHETFAFLADTCAEHRLSLSTILQEMFIDDHTPMYWAIVNSHQEFLVALLVHSRPLTIQTISDIRRACLVRSNQTLFHALRVRSHPFHVTDGIQVPSSLAASPLLGDCPTDEIYVQEASAQGFIVSFDIPLWQKRVKAIGQVSIEFIASGRMWSVTFFSAKAQSKTLSSKKSKRDKRTWQVMVNLLESSSPTFFDSLLVVDALPPLVPDSIEPPRLREVRSQTFPLPRDGWNHKRSSMYDHGCDGRIQSDLSKGHNACASWADKDAPSSLSRPLPLIPPLRGSSGPSPPPPSTARPPSISIRLGCGNRKLGRRARPGEPLEPAQLTAPHTWSDNGVRYTNAAVSPVGEGLASQLLYERSQYVFPDGTLRGRLEARFVKLEESKGCIIC